VFRLPSCASLALARYQQRWSIEAVDSGFGPPIDEVILQRLPV
jgi:hypothetical protein